MSLAFAFPPLPAPVRRWRHPLVRAVVSVLLALAVSHVSAAPQVTVTIKPLELLAAAVTDGVSEPLLALAPAQDPHHLSLRPSERRALAQADLILWIGPLLEQPLAAAIDNTGVDALAVQRLEGLILLQAAGRADPHVWLDTRNARLITAALAAQLATLDPDNAEHYQRNQRQFVAALDQLDVAIRAHLAGLETRQWAVYHHAYRYVEQQYALQAPLTLADDHNNPPGIRSVLTLKEQLQQGQVQCVLSEPGVNQAELASMLAPARALLLQADVMGLHINADAGAYVRLMEELVERVAACLRGSDD